MIFSAPFNQNQVNYAMCIPSVFRTRMNHHILSVCIGNFIHLKTLFLHLLELPSVLSAVVELHSVLLLHKAAGSCSD